MYRGVTISVKALTGAILAGLAALALAIVFLAGSGGFTVTFETDGGSQVPAQTCRYGELVRRPEDPVKQTLGFCAGYGGGQHVPLRALAARAVNAAPRRIKA